ncbi:MAG: GNAT family N-acetyltransferase, partial [Saccharospirillaceae bacterium]|nr:hypothetical protein [Pseudomonadales bacterium]NRB81630.1 GNAT family N-acetyltransferase [Saccharospirillaceae bacterium]
MLIYRKAIIADLPILLQLEQKVIEAERPFNSAIKSEQTMYYDVEQLIVNDDTYMLVVQLKDSIIATGYAQIRESKVSLIHETHAYLGFMF